MRKLFSALKYIKNYRGNTALNILFNILFALFNAAVFALIQPFLELLFKSDSLKVAEIVLKGEPQFSASSSYFTEFMNFHLASLVLLEGKTGALILICLLVVLVTVLKNISRYLAMFFIAPIRNGVVRDLRNRMEHHANIGNDF